jgi:hypothetical protein
MVESNTIIAIALETAGDGVTGARGQRRANDPTAPSVLPAMAEMAEMAEMAGRLDTASHVSETERHTPRRQFLPGRVRPI